MRLNLSPVCWLLLGLLCLPPAASAQDRRGRSTPGIVLDTGARLGNCDVLTFSPEGDELLAVGDDKVVRAWKVGPDDIDAGRSRAIRWPIYREQVGAIYAMALSPGDGGKRVAIGGHGLQPGLVAAIDRAGGERRTVMPRQEQPYSGGVTTYITWSPDGKYTVHGTQDAELFRWDPSDNGHVGVRFAGPSRKEQWVRLIAFLKDGRRFVVATKDGKLLVYDVLAPKSPPKLLKSFPDEIYRAALSPDKRWLALARMSLTDTSRAHLVDLIDLDRLLKQGADAPDLGVVLQLQRRIDEKVERRPSAFAFDANSQVLAVGTQDLNTLPEGEGTFPRCTGGAVHLWSLSGDAPERLTSLDGYRIGYEVNAIAFRPGKRQFAVAGGSNHEVRLFRLDKEGPPLSEVRSPGSCLWAVGLTEDGSCLAWREQLNPDPKGPHDRAAGPWRYFTLTEPADGKGRRIVEGLPPGRLVEPLTALDGWSVEPTGVYWRVKHRGGYSAVLNETNDLYWRGPNQIPQCYTFLKPPAGSGKPPRLAVGHMWGVSVYELRPKSVKLARVMLGHQGLVMALAPSPNGEQLFSASRDQTICCWSLVDWPSSPELGAKFSVTGGQVVVAEVDPGSPAWDVNLSVGDTIEAMAVVEPASLPLTGAIYNPIGRLSPSRQFPGFYTGDFKQEGRPVGWGLKPRDFFDAQQAVDYLHQARPSREHLLAWRDPNTKVEEAEKTNIRQRPLWVFFPTRQDQGSHWLIWRWRDYYYDCDMRETERLAGLQRTFTDADVPTFVPLASVAGPIKRSDDLERQYYNPAMIWPYIRDSIQRGIDPRKVLFADVQPPTVELVVKQWPYDPKAPKGAHDLKVEVTVTPYRGRDGTLPPRQRVRRVSLWLDDFLLDAGDKLSAPDPRTGAVTAPLTIPHAQLRRGTNRLRAVGFNAAGGVAEKVVEVKFDNPARGKSQLLALCVGVSDYSGVRRRSPPGFVLRDLRCPRNDAKALWEVFHQHKNSELFEAVKGPPPLIDSRATLQAITAELEKFENVARPDDWLVLTLSGHGAGVPDPDVEKAILPGSFYFLCHDTVAGKPETGLRGQDLSRLLGKINCHKLILMDACHSGDKVPDLVRDLNRDTARFLMFTACKNTEEAGEPDLERIKEAIEQYPDEFIYLKKLNLQHGLFTLGLLNTLGNPETTRGQARLRPVTADEVRITITSTIAAMRRNLKQSAKDPQTPVFFPDDPQELRRLAIFCVPVRPGAKP